LHLHIFRLDAGSARSLHWALVSDAGYSRDAARALERRVRPGVRSLPLPLQFGALYVRR
jgi:hypothetical protein